VVQIEQRSDDFGAVQHGSRNFCIAAEALGGAEWNKIWSLVGQRSGSSIHVERCGVSMLQTFLYIESGRMKRCKKARCFETSQLFLAISTIFSRYDESGDFEHEAPEDFPETSTIGRDRRLDQSYGRRHQESALWLCRESATSFRQ
jgi:hypothetical protein